MEQELKILKFYTGPPDNMNEIDVKPSLPGKRHQRRRLGANTLLRAAIPKQRAQGQGGEAWAKEERHGKAGKVKAVFYQAGYGFTKTPSWLLGQRQYHGDSLRELPSSVHQRKERGI